VSREHLLELWCFGSTSRHFSIEGVAVGKSCINGPEAGRGAACFDFRPASTLKLFVCGKKYCADQAVASEKKCSLVRFELKSFEFGGWRL
jgi:hypothetical protein